MSMATLVIRDVSEELHSGLKQRAAAHRRSVNKEVVTILEQAMARSLQLLPPPVKGTFALTQEWLDQARNQGRE